MKNTINFNWPKIFEVFYFIFLIAIASFAIVNLTSRFSAKSPFKILSVVSGSMTPELKVGSAIFVQKASDYSRDEIITYQFKNNFVTHRVFYAGEYFLTKGDANKEVDQIQVQKDQIVGKVKFSLPYLGYLQESTKSLWGLVVFVYIPTLVVLIAESKLIIGQIRKIGVKEIPLGSLGTICIGIFVLSGISLAFYSKTSPVFSANLTSMQMSPSPSPSVSPSNTISPSPTALPSASPTIFPSPTAYPSISPSILPTINPSATPSATPSSFPCPANGANNCGNGAGSNNTVIIDNNSSTIINQQNNSQIQNTIIINSNTGGNKN